MRKGELVLRSKLNGIKRELVFKGKYHAASLRKWRKEIISKIFISKKVGLVTDYIDGKENRIVVGINKDAKYYQEQENKVIAILSKLYIPRNAVILKKTPRVIAGPLIIRNSTKVQ